MKRQTTIRAALFTAACLCLAVAWWRGGPAPRPVKASLQSDPNVLWRIGSTDGSAGEFRPGTAPQAVYDAPAGIPSRDWPREQAPGAVYTVRFRLDAVPPAPLLAAELYAPGIAPTEMEVAVNGTRGSFRMRPAPPVNLLDDDTGNSLMHARFSVRAPLPNLRPGDNELALSFSAPRDAQAGAVWWDSLELTRSGGETQDVTATVEPTIFFRRRGEALKEVAEIVLRHRAPLPAGTAVLKLAGTSVAAPFDAAGPAFGERVLPVEVPALAAPAPYDLEVRANGSTASFRGEFRPDRRWRIFAGLKIHNDIGFTDYQSNVQELDNRNTDHVLELLRRFPFWKFVLEDTWLVENYLGSRASARGRELMAYAAADRVGINPLYNNIMTGMATGEELHRALYAARALQRRYGVRMPAACLTDAPSHTWFVPSLLAANGVKAFALGSNQSRAPLLNNGRLNEDSPFYWEGVDGRRIMAWYARSYLQFNRLAGDRPTPERLRTAVGQALARYRRPDYPLDAILLYGLYTDNAGIREGEAATIAEWNKTWEFPKITPSTDGDYFAYVSGHFADKLPVYKGDGGAYWEDGAGSTAFETALNRDSQRMLPAAEIWGALATACRPAETWPAQEFRQAWKNLLFFDEHTWGASRSIAQPDRDITTRQWDYKRAYAWRANWAAKDLLMRGMGRLVHNIGIQGPTLFVFNPDLWPRTAFVEIEIEPNRTLTDLATGRLVARQVLREQQGYQVARFLAEGVPGMGYKAYAVGEGAGAVTPKTPAADRWTIASRYYRLRFDPATGGIAELRDLDLNRDLADPAAPYRINELLYVAGGDRTSIIRNGIAAPARLDIRHPSDARVVENDGHRIVVRASAPSLPEIETEVLVDDAVKRISIVNRLVKEEVREKEAVYFAFPFRVSPPELAYQVQNAWVRPDTDQLPGASREWFTTQNVAVARDATAAIAWATPDAPLITLTDINRGLWLKKLNVANGHIFSYAMNNYWFTNYKAGQGGRLTFRYFITSASRLTPEELARFDAETRSPLLAYDYYNTGNVRIEPVGRRLPATQGQFFQIDTDHAQVTAFKPAEDGSGFILRLRETAGRRGAARLSSPVFPLASAALASGVEDTLRPLPVKAGAVEAPLAPWEFTTLRLDFAQRTGGK